MVVGLPSLTPRGHPGDSTPVSEDQTAGDSRDCASARRDAVVLEADRVRSVRVEARSVACLATVTNRRLELHWHKHEVCFERWHPAHPGAVFPGDGENVRPG
jgi:hypothetical protein